jgi:hypothetical protein
MKLFCAFTLLAATAFASVNPQLQKVKRVYILSMGSGMDQYLANQLTKAGIFEVVTDPKTADAIFTDNVGEAFQKKVDDLYPAAPPPPVATKPAVEADAALDVGQSSASDSKAAKKDALDLGAGFSHTSSFGRGKGNFFVVDRNSRTVLWSVYVRSKNSTPGELTKTAGRVVKHLQEDLTDKKPGE